MTTLATRPLWLRTTPFETGPLTENITADVCIVGAGISGLLVAERLLRSGVAVVLIDRGPVGAGETGHTTSHLTCALDDRFEHIARLHGEEGARLALESHAAAVDHIEALVREYGIECSFRRVDGYLVVNERHREQAEKLLSRELEAVKRAGFTRAERAATLPAGWPTQLGPAIRFPGQAQMDPGRFMRQLAERLVQRGLRLHTRTEATKIEGGKDARVETPGGVVRCGAIVVATNTPVNDVVTMHTKQAGYQTYVIAARIARGALPPALLWDGAWENDPWYRYIRLDATDAPAGDDYIIAGGEDHKTGQQGDDTGQFDRLEAWTRAHFPMAGPVAARWSGEVMEPADAMAYIGPNPTGAHNVFIVTGDSGNGMTMGGVAALLLGELVRGKSHAWARLYDPARKIGWSGLADYTRENVNTAAQYADWLRAGDYQSEADVPPGGGGVVVEGLRRIAVSRDSAGRCTRVSAVCTHLGGVVRWNAVEKTWDCPCHASRFAPSGKVIHGPANRDLAPAPKEAEAPAAEMDAS